ncbi:MAG: hypothetical protein WA661_19415 [Xanthobacteraceae bacterium]
MPNTKCPKCDSLVFELVSLEIQDVHFPHNAIQCANCGRPIGVIERENIGALLAEHDERNATFRASISTRLGLVQDHLSRLNEAFQRLNSRPPNDLDNDGGQP